MEDYAHESIKKLFALASPLILDTEIALVREIIVNISKQYIYNSLHALLIGKETSCILPDIKITVLILVGKEDKITPPEMPKSIQKKKIVLS